MVCWALAFSAAPAGGELVLTCRVERVEVLEGLSIVLPLRLSNLSAVALRAVEPSPYLNSLSVRVVDAEGQELPGVSVIYSPIILNTQPQVIVLAPGEGADVDLWLGAFGRSSLVRGEYSVTVTYRCAAYDGWDISPQIRDRAGASEPVAVTVNEPTSELDRAAAAMLAGRPRLAPAPLDELVNRHEAHLRAVVERYPESAYAVEACFRAARLLYHEGEPGRALAWIERLRRMDPDFDPAEELAWIRIDCLLALGRRAEVEPLLRSVKTRRSFADWWLARIEGGDEP